MFDGEIVGEIVFKKIDSNLKCCTFESVCTLMSIKNETMGRLRKYKL